MTTTRWICAGTGLLALLFGGLTMAALELHEVVVVRTQAADGSLRETRIWIAEEDGDWVLEAGTPENAWYRDIIEEPRAEIVRGDRVVAVRLRPLPGPEGRVRIRQLVRRKYGLADRWIAFIQDGSRSVLVHVERLED